MKSVYVGLALTTALCAGLASARADEDAAEIDRKAIGARVESYVEAFDAADAKAMAGHWSETGEYITPEGERISGRDKLAERFAEGFAAAPGMRLEVQVESIRLIAQDAAVEEGTARVITPGETPDDTSYLAIHVRHDGQWQLDTVRETSLPGPSVSESYARLQELEWMIGDWRDEGEGSSVTTNCRWTANRTFLTRTFRVVIDGQIDMQGTQVIGWDPTAGQIRSWVFDSDGGFGEGVWKNEGDHWVVQARATLPDGRQASAVQIVTRVDEGRCTWESTQRDVDGQLLPDVEPVTIVRSTETENAAAPASEIER